jgi:plastocyanin
MEGDGNFQASNAKTGELLWQFQTGFLGSGPISGIGGVPAATYDFEGTQYVAVPMGNGIWAFTLDGTKSSRPALPPPPAVFGFSGSVQQLADDGTGEISMSAVGSPQYSGWQTYYKDEYAFAPARARIHAGSRFKWTNLGVERHTIVSSDGSWTTGSVLPGQSVVISVARPGTYVYFCKDHPWSKGQLIVSAAYQSGTQEAPGVERGVFTSEQATRGKMSFQQSCSNGCHMSDLTGGERVPALAGDSFLKRWQDSNADALFERIRSTMPQQNPHSLSDQTYIDILAFLLQANGFPSGSMELKSETETLNHIALKAADEEH